MMSRVGPDGHGSKGRARYSYPSELVSLLVLRFISGLQEAGGQAGRALKPAPTPYNPAGGETVTSMIRRHALDLHCHLARPRPKARGAIPSPTNGITAGQKA